MAGKFEARKIVQIKCALASDRELGHTRSQRSQNSNVLKFITQFNLSLMFQTVSVKMNYGNVKQDVFLHCEEALFVEFAAAFENQLF